MGNIEVTPAELHGASQALGSVSGELGCGELAQGGNLGTGELEDALMVLAARLDLVSRAMSVAITATSRRLDGGAELYAGSDRDAMPTG